MEPLRLIYRRFDGFERAFGRQAAAYQEREPGFALRLEALDVPPLYTKMVAERGCLGDEYDIFLAVTDWLPDLMRDGLVTPLDDFLAETPPDGWPEGWPPSLLGLQRDDRGRIWGLPYHASPEVLIYRGDLFDDAGERDRFRRRHGRELAPPRTWGEFLEVGRFFHRPDEGLHGCVVAAKADGHNDVYDFLIHLWSRGGILLDERNRPAFASPEGKRRCATTWA